jgi:hypothetical protein
MQRISLDSSASKLHSYGGRKDDTYDIDDLKPASSSPSSSSSAVDYDDHELKDFKPRRLSSLQSPFVTTNQKQEKLVHFIPILTLICFIILYLTSYAPSQSDLAQFNGFMRPSKHLGTLQIRFPFRILFLLVTHWIWVPDLIVLISTRIIRRKWRRNFWIYQSRYSIHP